MDEALLQELEAIRARQEDWDERARAIGNMSDAVTVLGPRPIVPPHLRGKGPNFMQGLGSGIAQGFRATGAGLSGLGAMVPSPAQSRLERINRALVDSMQESDAKFENARGTARAGRMVGRIGSEIAQALVPAGLATKAARGLGAGARLAAGVGLATDAATEGVIEAGNTPENSLAGFLGLDKTAESTLGRAGVGAAGGLLVGGLFEGIGAARRGSKARDGAYREMLEQDGDYRRALQAKTAREAREGSRYNAFATDSDSRTLLSGLSPKDAPRDIHRQTAKAGRTMAESGVDPRRARPGVPMEARPRTSLTLTPAQARVMASDAKLKNITLDEAYELRDAAQRSMNQAGLPTRERNVFQRVFDKASRKLEDAGVDLEDVRQRILQGEPVEVGPFAPVPGAPPVRGAQRIVPPSQTAGELDTISEQIGNLYTQLGELSNLNPADLRKQGQLQIQLTRLERQQSRTMYEYLGGVSEAAKELNVQRARVQGAKNVTGLLTAIQRGIGRKLTASEIDELTKAQAFVRDASGRLTKVDDAQIASFIVKNTRPLSYGDVKFYTSLIRSGMLSAPFSVSRAALGGMSSTVTQTIGAPARAGWDAFARKMVHWAVEPPPAMEAVLRRLGGDAKPDLKTMRGVPRKNEANLRIAARNMQPTFHFGELGKQFTESARGFVRGVRDIPGTIARGRGRLDEFGNELADEAFDGQSLGQGRQILDSGIKVPMPKFVRDYLESDDVAHIWGSVWYNLQAAMDAPWRRAFGRASLVRSGVNRARAAGAKKGSAEWDRIIQETLDSPDPVSMMEAMNEARFGVFQQDTAVNDILQGIRNAPLRTQKGRLADIGAKAFEFGVDLTIPFARTPSAIVSRAVSATPIGAVQNLGDVITIWNKARALRGMSPVQQKEALRLISDRIAESGRRVADQAVVGGVAMLTVPMARGMLEDGAITGPVPSDPEERRKFFAEGKQPYSMLVDGEWLSLAQMPPLGYALAFGATVADHFIAVEKAEARGDDPGWGGLAGVAGSLVGNAADLAMESPFFQGPARAVAARGSPEQANRFAAGYAGALVPNLFNVTSRAMDDTQRFKRRENPVEAMWDEVISRTPLRHNLPAKVDKVTGDVLKEKTGRKAWLSIIDPFGSRPSRAANDPLLDELSTLPRPLPDPRRLPGETEREFNQRARVEGPLVRSALEGFLLGDQQGLADLVRAWAVPDPLAETTGGDPIEEAINEIIAMQIRYRQHKEDGTDEDTQGRAEIIQKILTKLRTAQDQSRDPVATIRGDEWRNIANEILGGN